jgi:hypothetical protein
MTERISNIGKVEISAQTYISSLYQLFELLELFGAF